MKRLFGLLFLFLLCTNSFSQTVCRPVSQTSSQGGLVCLGLNIDSPANAFDSAGLATFASLTNAVGLGCFVEETMTLNQTAKAGDQIAIYFGIGNGLLDVGLLSNASIQAKLSGTNVGSSVALNNPILNLNLLSGNAIGVIKYTLTGDANQVQIQVGGLLSLLVNLKIYDVRLEFAQPVIAGGLSQTVCSGSTTTLTATPSAGTTLTWYSSASSTTVLATGNSFTTPALTTTTTYYVAISRLAVCEGNVRVPVVLNVSNPVAPAVNNAGTAICSTGATQQTTLSLLNPIPGTTYSWYAASSGGVALASGNSYSPTVPLGTTNFYVEASIGSCISPTRTAVNVVSTAVPALPTVLTQSVTIQSGQNATLTAAAPGAGVQLNWYDVVSGGTALATNTSTFTTPILTATKTFYVEAQSSNGSCVSASRVPVIVTVQPAALGGCLAASSQQTLQNGLCLLCSTTTSNNSVDGNPATAARLTLPVGLLNGWIQQTLQFTNPGRAGDIVDVEIELPGGLADVSLLGGVTLATYNGTTFNNDRVLINNPLITLQLLSGTRYRASVVAGANFDRVEVRLGGLVTALTNLDIYQAAYRYKTPVISGNTTICSGQTTTLTATLAVGETANWYSAATGGPSLVSTAAFTTPSLTAATTYYVEITRNGCVNSARTPVLISVDSPVLPSVSASPSSICSGQSTTLTVQAPVAGTTYNWYDAQTAGNLLFTGTSFATPALTANTDYYVEAVIGTCSTPTRTPVNLTINPLPAVPTFASSDVIIQSGQTVALSVLNPVAGVRYNWYNVLTGGAPIAFNTTSYTPSPVLTANTTYYVEAVNTLDCVNPVRGIINVIVIANMSTCLQAGTQVTSRDPGLLCISCSAINPNNSVDGNINTYAQLSIPVGVLGSYIQQRLTFATPGEVGDIIDVELEIPVGLLDISALSYITLGTLNGGTDNNDRLAVNSNLLNVQLLSGNRFKASFTAGDPFDQIEVRFGGEVLTLANLYIYGASYRFPNAAITGPTAPICAGSTATLSAVATGTEVLTWYDAPTGGNVVAVSPTAPLFSTTTYYLEGTRNVTCTNSLRQAFTVNVLSIPTAADITIASPIEASCEGEAALAPTSTFTGAQFRYYTNQNKTEEIISGTSLASQPGVTFIKDPVTGALTINNLNAAVTPFTYFVSVSNGGICENAAGTLKPVTVNFPSTAALIVNSSPAPACGSFNLRNAITNFDSTGNTTYTFFNPSNTVITADEAANITTSGIYKIQAQSIGATCSSAQESVNVVINAIPSIVVTNPSESVNIGSNVTLTAVSTGTITWFDPNGNALTGPVFTTGVLNTPGVYTYTAVASDGTCTASAVKVINVINLSSCQSLTDRVYATGQSQGSIITGTVNNGANAIDGNPQTFSTITTGVGLLGVGTTWQNLTWPANILKGTPVTIKLGSEYSLLAVGQNLSVIGTKAGVDIGTMQSVSGSLLNLISGDNSYEFTFVPSDASGPQDYDGIRIQSASLLSAAQNTKVFDAFYNRSVSTVACTPGDIRDVFYGATDLGLPVGAVTATVGVSDAFNVADNDITTYATMYSGVNVLSAADLTVEFKTPSIVSDSLRIVISKPGAILDLTLLNGFTIQRYLKDVAVGAPIQSTSSLLSLRVLPGNTMAVALISSPTESYDRVRIRFGGVASVLDFLRVHTVERAANTSVIGADPINKVTVCPGTDVTLQIPEEDCSTYIWYDAPTGGNVVATGITYSLPVTLAAGTYKYYVQPVRYGCEAFARGEVIVEIKATSPTNALTNITLNGLPVNSICSPTGTVTLATGLSGTPVLTNPVYHWYRFDGTTSQVVAGETTSQLTINGLMPGTYTYYVGVSSDEFCETVEAARKQITFTILPPSTMNDIVVSDLTVCHSVPASLTPTAPTLTTPVFTWYLDAGKTQPIVNNALIGGVTYTISAAGVLTAVGLTKAMSPKTYYVAVSSTNTCENLAGTLQEAVIMISDPNTPTTTDTTQDFCLIDAPTIASIQVNESNVVWYNLPLGGASIAAGTALTNAIYYGAATDAVTGCESSVRLPVTITVTDPGTPTTTDTTQNFCLADAPKVSNLQVNAPAAGNTIVWYTASTGGTVVASTTALTNGLTYYASFLNAATNCQSAVRLAVAVTVTDPGTPTTTDTTQDFCLADAPKVSNLQVNAPAAGNTIVWYSSAIGGTVVASTTALTNGLTYYASLLNAATNCQSAVRLAVAVTVTDPGTPVTTDTTQDFCLADAPKVSNLQVNAPAAGTTIVWYTAAAGGTVVASTTALTNGLTYYASFLNAATNCQSAVRLAVAVTVTDPGTPTTTDTTQDFCLADAPKVSNLQVNAPAAGNTIVWYTAAAGGTVVASTTALTNGLTYYASFLNAATNCQSAVRLAVAVTITDPGTPVTTDATQDFCLAEAPKVSNLQVNVPAAGTTIIWYSSAIGGTVVASTTALTNGLTYYASFLNAATNCQSAVRLAVAVTVTDPGTPTTADATQDFCLADAPKVSNIQVNAPAAGNTIVWYSSAIGGTVVASTTALTNGLTYYASFLNAATNCQSAVRLAVAVTITDPGTPVTTDTTQDFCLADAPKVSNLQVNAPAAGNTIVWYTAAAGGTVVASTTALTNGLTYYASFLNAATNCQSAVRLAVAVTVTDPGTPTTTDTTQDFCLADAPKISNLQVNAPAAGNTIVWYTAAAGGTVVASTTALTNGLTYYASLLNAATNCQSAVRLAVAVTVTDPGTPTTADATQDFCLADAPKVSNIQVNAPAAGTTIVWYTAATGGTVVASTTALVSTTYYASFLNSATNCQSAVRLAVAVTVTDPGTPTTADATQDFCLADAPKVSNLQVNAPAAGSTIVWYTAATGGTVVASTTALTNGLTYYASLLNAATNCQSAVRLAVAVTVTDPGTPVTTDTTQDFCLADAPKVSNLQVNAPAAGTTIVWYTAAAGGTVVASTTALTNGLTYYASFLNSATNCQSAVRLAVAVTVTDPGTPTTADTTQDFCLADAPKVSNLQVNAPAAGNTIVWYTASAGGTVVASTTALTNGLTYYASFLNTATNCQSAVRLAVAVTVTDPGTPTTTDTTQDFCLADAPKVSNLQVNAPAAGTTIVWYSSAIGGAILASTTALTNGLTYYASFLNATTNCQSAVRLAVAVTITNPATPTTNAASQTFCSGNAPTVASIQVNAPVAGTTIVWYKTAIGGTALASTTALISDNYYGVIKNTITGCESSIRLLVAVTVGNTINPTTTNTAQSFCSTASPTVADIQVNESNVTWFAASTGGTAISAATALTSGIYYGNIVDPVSGCESSTRLKVTVTVTNPSPTPTTTDITQDFCSTNAPTVASIQVNQANVIWYSTAIGGTAIPAATALVTGTYYGAVSSTINCENPARLAVAVTVNTPGVVTTPRTKQIFCLAALPTIANIVVNEPNVVFYSSESGGTQLPAGTLLTAGIYYAGTLSNTTNGCSSANRLGITIAFEDDAAVQLAATDDTPCVFQGVTYSIANGKSNYVWSVSNGTITSGGGNADGSVTISWSDIGPGRVQVTYTNNCNETVTKFLNVTVATCSDLTITNVVDNPTPNFGDHVTFTVTVNNVGEGNFINTIVSEILPSGYNLVSSNTSVGTYDPATQLWTIPTLNSGQSVVLTIVAEVLSSGNYVNVAAIEISTPLDTDASNNSASASVEPVCLTVYNEFTPNNDGANDLFRIDCIESYPNNELKVFNRYGALVYSKEHYENNWDGTANVSGVVNRGDMLPTGTYFYVITIGDGTVKKGWLSIMR